MKPIMSKLALDLKQEFIKLPMQTVKDLDMAFENNYSGDKSSALYVGDFYIVELEPCTAGKYFVSNNHNDPENPVSVNDVISSLLEEIDVNIDKPVVININDYDDMKAVSYYGKYVNSLDEALAWIHNMQHKPVVEWDKEYNQPVDPVSNPIATKFTDMVKYSDQQTLFYYEINLMGNKDCRLEAVDSNYFIDYLSEVIKGFLLSFKEIIVSATESVLEAYSKVQGNTFALAIVISENTLTIKVGTIQTPDTQPFAVNQIEIVVMEQ